MDFSALSEAVFAAHGDGDHVAALTLIDDHTDAVRARHRPRLVFWRACILSLLDRPEEALTTLVRALGQGIWWDPAMLDSDPDLEAARRLPAWDEFRDRLLEHRDEAVDAASPRLVVERPGTPVREPCPAVLVLHGAGGNAADTRPHWLAVLEAGWVLALAQSSRPAGTSSFVWDGYDRSIAEVEAHVEALDSLHLDVRSSVLGGFSQGAGIAVAAVLSGHVPATRFLAHAPSFRTLPSGVDQLVTRPDASTVEGVIVVGSEDHGHDGVVQAALQLRGRIGRCELDVVQGVGHGAPPDFADRLRHRLAAWVTDHLGRMTARTISWCA